MPSPADRGRRWVELGLRVTTLGALAVALFDVVRPAARGADAPVKAGVDSARLAEWTARAPRDLHVALAGAPRPLERDWLAAIARAGTRVRWSGTVSRVLVASEPAAMPDGGSRLLVAAPAGSALAASDGAGPLDTLVAGPGGGVQTMVSDAAGTFTVAAAGTRASVRVRRSPPPRSVLVLGRAGWEGKFVAAALEESGWPVRLRLQVAPSEEVRQGASTPPDTLRDAAVVVLDSVAVDAARLDAYVRSGGGLIVVGAGATSPGIGRLLAGVPAREAAGVAGAIAGTAPRNGLALRAVSRPRADAAVLEWRGAAVAVAARRVGAGRVVQVGYADSWRWRMQGDGDAPAGHRRWWASLVAAAAYVPPDTTGVPPASHTDDPAPLASLVSALGPAVTAPHDATPSGVPTRRAPPWLLFSVATLALLLEWTSRRLRGAA